MATDSCSLKIRPPTTSAPYQRCCQVCHHCRRCRKGQGCQTSSLDFSQLTTGSYYFLLVKQSGKKVRRFKNAFRKFEFDKSERYSWNFILTIVLSPIVVRILAVFVVLQLVEIAHPVVRLLIQRLLKQRELIWVDKLWWLLFVNSTTKWKLSKLVG